MVHFLCRLLFDRSRGNAGNSKLLLYHRPSAAAGVESLDEIEASPTVRSTPSNSHLSTANVRRPDPTCVRLNKMT